MVYRSNCSEFIPGASRGHGTSDDEDPRFEELLQVVRQGEFRQVVDIVSQGVDFKGKSTRGLTPLMVAAMSPAVGSYAIVLFLLDAHADIEGRDEDNMTPLLHACRNSNMEVVALLMKQRASVSVHSHAGQTAAMFAVGEGEDDLVKKLVKQKTPIHQRDRNGWSILYHACAEGRHALVAWLLERKGNPREKALNGRTAFMVAMMDGDTFMGEMLMRQNANPSAQDAQGNTPLMLALLSMQKEASLWLIQKAGTDVELENKQTWTASDCGRSVGMFGMAELIDSAVFNINVKRGQTNFDAAQVHEAQEEEMRQQQSRKAIARLSFLVV